MLPAFVITLIGMTESIAVGQTLGAAKRQHISTNRELLGLGAANLAAGFSGGFPVTGGMSRSVVNADAGAETPLAGALTAVFLSIGILLLTPYLAYIPIPVLAATIIVAVSQLLEFGAMTRILKMDRADGLSAWLTALAVMFWDVEKGILVGVVMSVFWLMAKQRKPYVAVLGLISGTERFKNINHAETETLKTTLFLRIDESLSFLNASVLEQDILERIAHNPNLHRLVIVASGIHSIDASGANMLKRLQQEMTSASVELYISDVKVPLARKMNAFQLFAGGASRMEASTIELFRRFKALED
jgi:SulP family sulfate permease